MARELRGEPLTAEQLHVEPWQAGGWVVRLEGHPVPVSRHDTEEEAELRAGAYRRAIERGQQAEFSQADDPPQRPAATGRPESGLDAGARQ